MILTDEEIQAAICSSKDKWNSEADHMNKWRDISWDEQCELSGREVEAAVLAKLADKLLDAERLDYHLEGNPMTVKMKKSILMLGPNKEPEYPLAFRYAIDAAILARKAEKP